MSSDDDLVQQLAVLRDFASRIGQRVDVEYPANAAGQVYTLGNLARALTEVERLLDLRAAVLAKAQEWETRFGYVTAAPLAAELRALVQPGEGDADPSSHPEIEPKPWA